MYSRRKVQSNGHDSLSIKVALYPPPHDLEIAIIVAIIIVITIVIMIIIIVVIVFIVIVIVIIIITIVVTVMIIITINFDNVVWSDKTGSVTDLLMAPL